MKTIEIEIGIGKCGSCGQWMMVDTRELKIGDWYCSHCGHRYVVRAAAKPPKATRPKPIEESP